MPTKSPFQAMRKYWKTNLVLWPVGSAALYYFYDLTRVRDMMRYNCSRAAEMGDQKMNNPLGKVKDITVILNPMAGKRSSRTLYNRWVEPILNLSGCKVNVIETQSPNHAHDLMKDLTNCDGVAIVGGDGTVREAIEGLMTRTDSAKISSEVPMAIIPTGQSNSIAKFVYKNKLFYRNKKEFLMQTTINFIDPSAERPNLLKIPDMEEDIKKEEEAAKYWWSRYWK